MRTLFLATFVSIAFFVSPAAVSALTADGSYCESSSQCASGYCQGDAIGLGGTCQPTSGGTGTTGGTRSGGTGTINSGSPQGTNITLINPLKSGTSLESFLDNILKFVIRIGTIVVILMLVFVGFKFVVAQGSDTKISEARNMLLWTVIGALVLLGAQAISMGIKATVQALSVGG
jgi:hypothetical protein